MLIVISPAKTLDFKNPSPLSQYTVPRLLDESEKLAEKLRELNAETADAAGNPLRKRPQPLRTPPRPLATPGTTLPPTCLAA